MCKVYSTQWKTRRWPLALFYGLLNLSDVNSMVINNTATKEKPSRREFINRLGFALLKPYLVEHPQWKTLPKNIRKLNKDVLASKMKVKHKLRDYMVHQVLLNKGKDLHRVVCQQHRRQWRKKSGFKPGTPGSGTPRIRRRCCMCPRTDNKQSVTCTSCREFVCGEYR